MASENYLQNQSTDSSANSVEALEKNLKLSQLEIARAVSDTAEKNQLIQQQQAKIQELEEKLTALGQTVVVQRKKIQSLVMVNEQIGAEREILVQLEKRLLHISPQPHVALAELLAWRELGSTRLAPSLAEANHQLNLLIGYANNMSSPGHRITSFIGKHIGSNFVGRRIKAVFNFLFLLTKS